MSWAFPPVDVTFAATRAAGGAGPVGTSTAVLDCLVGVSTVECHLNDTLTGSATVPVAATLAVLDGVDSYAWYAVGFTFDFPNVIPGQDVCVGLEPIPCSRSEDYVADSAGALVDALTVVDSVDGTTLATSNSGTPGSGGSANAWSLPDPGAALPLIVNPSPSYPVPDAHGNTAGGTLWTHAELAALADPTINWSGDWYTGADWTVACFITGYRIVRTSAGNFMCVL